MPEAAVVERIRAKFATLAGELDERGRRRWAASEAVPLGWGGVAAVAEGTGISDRTIRNGIQGTQGGGPASLRSTTKARCRSPGQGSGTTGVDF